MDKWLESIDHERNDVKCFYWNCFKGIVEGIEEDEWGLVKVHLFSGRLA
jgi:hypothetical protein